MINIPHSNSQIQNVTTFKDLISIPFYGNINAICWNRKLIGDFSEIVNKLEINENVTEVLEEELHELQLSAQGQLARTVIFKDLKALTAFGAAPILNLIKCYERDDSNPFCPTDVYSFHADRSPIPTDTFLCTYYGSTSEILPNAQAEQKVLIPEIRAGLKKIYDGADEHFESFLSEQSFDLHYQAKPQAQPIPLGLGHLCRLAILHPENIVPPCLHRAPKEHIDQKRLLLIC